MGSNPIVQVECAAAAEQVWILTNVGNGSFHLMNALTGLCLDARGSATKSNASAAVDVQQH